MGRFECQYAIPIPTVDNDGHYEDAWCVHGESGCKSMGLCGEIPCPLGTWDDIAGSILTKEVDDE